MKKAFLLLAIAGGLTGSTFAQTWEQLNYYYPRTTQSNPRIFTSPNDKLVAGMSFNSSPASHVSLDGGTTWQQIFPDKAITSVAFGPDGMFYFVASKRYMTTSNYYVDTLFKSADGVTWTNAGYKLDAGNGTYTEYNFAITGSNKLLFPNFSDASGNYLSKSTDNAATWTPTAVKAGPVACSPSGDTIVVSTDSPWPGGIKYSHDGGVTVHDATWASGAPGGSIPVRTPDGTIYAASAGAVYKSTDGGMSFGTNLLSGPIGTIKEVIYASNGKFYIRVAGSVKGIWETSDFATFNAITGGLPDYALLVDMDVSNNYVYAVSDTNLYRYAIGGATKIEDVRETKLSIMAYPNPTSESLHVHLPEHLSEVKIELLDLSGKVVATALPNQNTLFVGGFAHGIYYLKVTAKGYMCMEKIVVDR
jgi:hypothetical protein